MSIAEKLTAIAENEQKVFDAGKKAEYDRFWDSFQNNGNRLNYSYAFSMGSNWAGGGWDDDLYNPKYPISVTGLNNITGTYQYTEKISDTKVEISVGQIVNGTQTGNMLSTFLNAKGLVTIRKLTVDETVVFSGTFNGCFSLENLTMAGTIGQNGFNVSDSTKLTHDSLMSIINCLEAKTEGTWTVTLGTENLAKLTDAEKAIATEKGWTLA